LNVDAAGASRDRARLVEAVADHQALAGGVNDIGVGIQVGASLGQQRCGQHLLGGDPAQLVQVDDHHVRVLHRRRGGVMD
jgi:hypothetical protein